MKKLTFLSAIVLITIFISCKKKENTPETTTSTTGPTSTVPSTYYGVLSASQFDFLISGTLTPSGGISNANFSTSPFINSLSMSEGAVNPLFAGTVSINSTVLKVTNNSGNFYYSDSTSTLFNSPFSWSVSGAPGVPAITYTYSSARPTYTGYASLKDTIKLSQTNIINLTGITGADEVVVTLSGGGYLQRNLAGNVTSLTLTTADLGALSATTSGGLFIFCYKNGYANFGGKDYKFKTGYALYKSIVVQ